MGILPGWNSEAKELKSVHHKNPERLIYQNDRKLKPEPNTFEEY